MFPNPFRPSGDLYCFSLETKLIAFYRTEDVKGIRVNLNRDDEIVTRITIRVQICIPMSRVHRSFLVCNKFHSASFALLSIKSLCIKTCNNLGT